MTEEQTTGGETADLTTLLDRNRRFAEHFAAGDLKISPRMSTILLTCLDARVDPAHVFGSDSATHSSCVTQAAGSPPQ